MSEHPFAPGVRPTQPGVQPSTPQAPYPAAEPDDDTAFYVPEFVASATECTGLSPAAVLDEQQADAYAQLYSVHKQKPVQVKGKGERGER